MKMNSIDYEKLLDRLFPVFIRNLDTFVIVLDQEYRIIFWNNAAEHCFALPPEYAEGKNLFSLPFLWDSKLIRSFLEKSAATRQSVSLPDLEVERIDNKTIWIGAKIHRIESPEDWFSFGFFITGIDITEKKQNLEMLAEDNKFRAIGELSAGIAHEINSPLQYIHNNLTFLESTFRNCRKLCDIASPLFGMEKPEEIKKQTQLLNQVMERFSFKEAEHETIDAIEQALEGVKRIEEIVKSLKNYAHPEQDMPVLADLNTIIKDAVTLSVNEWKYFADVELDLPPEPLEIKGFPGCLRQVVVNLLVNAGHAVEELVSIKKLERGKITVSLKDCEDHVVLKVADNGIGMRKDVKERIFEPFFTTKRIGKGSGQGLSIVYSMVVTKHRGEIRCESVVGEGSTFTVKLPKKTEVK